MPSQSGNRYPPDWDTRRRQVYQRDGYTCQRCGVRGGPHGDIELHCHHIIPISEGGSHSLSNLTTLCWRCHDAVHDHHIPRMSDVQRTETSDSQILDELQSEFDPAEYTPESRPYVRYWRHFLELLVAISAFNYSTVQSLLDITNDWYHYTQTYQQLPHSQAVQQFDAELRELERTYAEIDDAYTTFITHAATLPEKPPACADAERYVSGVVNEFDRIITHANALQTAEDIDELQHHYEQLLNSKSSTTPSTIPEIKQKTMRIVRELETAMRQRMEPAKDPAMDPEQTAEGETTVEPGASDNVTTADSNASSSVPTDTTSQNTADASNTPPASTNQTFTQFHSREILIKLLAFLLVLGSFTAVLVRI